MTTRKSASRTSPSFSLLGDDTAMRLYLRDIARYKPLSSAEEYRCAVLIRDGDKAALEKLVRSNLRFVVSVARNYQNQGMFLSDLINEGNLGLMRAARRFDERKNFRFISYAVWWIRQGILQALANQSRPLRFPLSRVSEVYRIQKTRAALEQKLHRLPNSQELAGELGIREKSVTTSDMSVAKHASLDAPVQFGSNTNLMDFVHSENHDDTGDVVGLRSLRRAIAELLDNLNDRERIVITSYYGIGKDTGHTLEDIGNSLGITRERVRQIKVCALYKLKRNVRNRRFDSFAVE